MALIDECADGFLVHRLAIRQFLALEQAAQNRSALAVRRATRGIKPQFEAPLWWECGSDGVKCVPSVSCGGAACGNHNSKFMRIERAKSLGTVHFVR